MRPSTSRGHQPTTPHVLDDASMPLFCPTGQTNFVKSADGVWNPQHSPGLGYCAWGCFRIFGAVAPSSRAATGEKGAPPVAETAHVAGFAIALVANEPPFTHTPRRLEI